MIETVTSLPSTALGYAKALWLYRTDPSRPASRVLVFLDAELYLRRIRAREVLEAWVADQGLRDVAVVFVSHGTPDQRNAEALFNPAFSAFLGQEFPAYLVGQHVMAPAADTCLCGLSLTGLATVLVALHQPGTYRKIAAQSGAYWPAEGRVLRELEALPPGGNLSFYFDVGSEETDREGEVMSQQEGVEAVTRALRTRGYDVATHVFAGGHSPGAWRAALPSLLAWAGR